MLDGFGVPALCGWSVGAPTHPWHCHEELDVLRCIFYSFYSNFRESWSVQTWLDLAGMIMLWLLAYFVCRSCDNTFIYAIPMRLCIWIIFSFPCFGDLRKFKDKQCFILVEQLCNRSFDDIQHTYRRDINVIFFMLRYDMWIWSNLYF